MIQKDLFNAASCVDKAWDIAYSLRKRGIDSVSFDIEGEHYVISSDDVLSALNKAAVYFAELKDVFPFEPSK